VVFWLVCVFTVVICTRILAGCIFPMIPSVGRGRGWSLPVDDRVQTARAPLSLVCVCTSERAHLEQVSDVQRCTLQAVRVSSAGGCPGRICVHTELWPPNEQMCSRHVGHG
jgi:hypothetical protein